MLCIIHNFFLLFFILNHLLLLLFFFGYGCFINRSNFFTNIISIFLMIYLERNSLINSHVKKLSVSFFETHIICFRTFLISCKM